MTFHVEGLSEKELKQINGGIGGGCGADACGGNGGCGANVCGDNGCPAHCNPNICPLNLQCVDD